MPTQSTWGQPNRVTSKMKLLHLVALALCALAVSSLPTDGDILPEQDFNETPSQELAELRHAVSQLSKRIGTMLKSTRTKHIKQSDSAKMLANSADELVQTKSSCHSLKGGKTNN